MISFDPRRQDFAPYGLTCVLWNPTPMARPDHHNEVELNFLRSGWLVYLLGGHKIRVEAGQLAAFWAAIPHQIIEFGPETEYWVVTIPLPWFLQWRLPDSFAQPLMRGEVQCEHAQHRSKMDQSIFSQWEQDLSERKHEMESIVLLEMNARLRRMASTLAVRAAPMAPGMRRNPPLQKGGLNKVEQMACFVAQRYTDQITVEEIGKAVGLHPNYAMSLFKKAFGTTLIEYLTHHRISHAQRLLATTQEKIVEIAFNSGFNSISRFNEVFRRDCGCTPRRYRVHHQLEAQN